MPFEAPNKNLFWTRLLVEELIRSGIDTFYISPGSRSTPLVSAVATHPKARAFVHYDERGSAFRALGYAKTSNRPAVWITTSGSALANGLPAVVEASMEQTPLILLTADRPPELRETAANQTIRQPGLFGDYVTWSFDLPCPSPDLDPAFVLTTIDHAVHRSRLGPVHVNCMFREPLAGTVEQVAYPVLSPRMKKWADGKQPYTRYDHCLEKPVHAAEWVIQALNRSKRPILSVGRLPQMRDGHSVQASIEQISGQLGVPVFPDICSGIRLSEPSRSDSVLVPFYDAILSAEGDAGSWHPDLVVQFGSPPVSGRYLQYVEKSGAELLVVSDHVSRIDPAHAAARRIQAPAIEVLATMAQRLDSAQAVDLHEDRLKWISLWRQLDTKAGEWHETQFQSHGDRFDSSDAGARLLTEQAVANIVSRFIGQSNTLVLGNSLPVRHVNTFAGLNQEPCNVHCNRGASGIDGTIATAAGVFDASGARVTVFLGDLALLYDLNSLSMAGDNGLIVVVINNDGGGIFSYLPIADQQDIFDRYFGAPHGYGFASAAAMFKLAYSQPETASQLEEVLREAVERKGGSLIELRTSRDHTAAEGRRLLEDLGEWIKQDRT